MKRLEREGRTMWMKSLLDGVAARVGRGTAALRGAGPVLVLATAAIVTAGGGVVAAALVTDPRGSPGSPGPRVSGPAGMAAEIPAPGSARLGRSVPVRIAIPAIGVDAAVVPVGLAGGDLAAPSDPTVAGWYEQGTSPGEPGSSVIVGRAAAPEPAGSAAPEPTGTAAPEPTGTAVPDATGPARPGSPVFARLDRLRPGDGIRVRRADGSVVSFAVDRTERYSSGEAAVDTAGEAQLRLVPAAGSGVDRGRHVVVFATLVP